jgi:RNA polymerase sigma-70 factor, ECF subfamily
MNPAAPSYEAAVSPPLAPSAPSPAAAGGADLDLVERLKAGDESAYERLVEDHGAHLLAVARRFMQDESDAQDAVQDAFLSAFKSVGRFEGGARLSTWLHRITVNACLMKLRSRRRRPERSIEGLLPEFLADGHAKNPSSPWNRPGAAGIEAEETRALVREKIAELPEIYRVVLLLRDIEELDTEETAAVLSISPTAVKTRLHRARQGLRELLDPCFAKGLA